jgi:prolyl oligopeptidase PreP (S9A serine peptidase family)
MITFVSSTGSSHTMFAITKYRDVLLVGADTGEGSMTTSGYPRTVREWTRGSKVDNAPIVFEGEDWVSSCVDHRLTFLRRPGTQAG